MQAPLFLSDAVSGNGYRRLIGSIVVTAALGGTAGLDNTLLADILQQVRPLIGQGKVADYIPALAEV